MNFNSVKGYVFVVLSGVYLTAAAILVLSNLGVYCDSITFFWMQPKMVSVGLMMLISAAVGFVTLWMARLMINGVKAIRRGRIEAKLAKVNQIEKSQKAAGAE
jgi:hypothetical protein